MTYKIITLADRTIHELNGLIHRENNLPAIEYSNGSKEWYLYGKLYKKTNPTKFSYDLNRMKESLNTPFLTMPKNLTFEQFKQWMNCNERKT